MESDSGASISVGDDSDVQSKDSNSKRKKSFQNNNAKSAKKKQNDDGVNYDALINRAMNVIEQPNDDLDLFGQFIASEMRQLPNESLCRVVKSEIMKTLIHYSTPLETILSQDLRNAGFSDEPVFVISSE